MRILLAGAGGFLGRNLGRMLHADGHEVIGLVRRSTVLEFATQTIVAETPAAIGALAVEQMSLDAIINTAAAGVDPRRREPAHLVEANVALPVILVGLADRARIAALIQIGSSAEYAEPAVGQFLQEDAPLDSSRLYGATKAAGTLAFLAAAAQSAIPAAVLRPFNLFGDGEAEHRLFRSLVARLRDGTEVQLSAGTQVRDFISVRDACRGIIATLQALILDPATSGTYNVCTGRPMSVADFARTVAMALGVRTSLLNFGAIPMRPDDLKWVVGSPDKIARVVGWRPNLDLEAEIAASLRGPR